MLCSIGEMARLLGIAPSTLRYYDKEGLLPSIKRSKGMVWTIQCTGLDLNLRNTSVVRFTA